MKMAAPGIAVLRKALVHSSHPWTAVASESSKLPDLTGLLRMRNKARNPETATAGAWHRLACAGQLGLPMLLQSLKTALHISNGTYRPGHSAFRNKQRVAQNHGAWKPHTTYKLFKEM